MVIIVSSLTGRTLFTMDVDDDVVILPPEAACVALVSLRESGLSDDIVIRDSQPNSARIPAGHLLGIGVFRSNQATVGADYPGSTERKEK